MDPPFSCLTIEVLRLVRWPRNAREYQDLYVTALMSDALRSSHDGL